MSSYKVTRTVVETIVVDGLTPVDGLETARDWGNQHDWSEPKLIYTVEEL